MKYKYTRKELLEKLGFDFKKKGIYGFPDKVKGMDLIDLLAKEDKKEYVKQLSDCCKAEIILTGKDRPNAFTCKKCGRIIGTPIIKNKITSVNDATCYKCGEKNCDIVGGNIHQCTPTPSPLEIEEIEEYFFETSYDRKIFNKLIRNQKKLYQFIKEKK